MAKGKHELKKTKKTTEHKPEKKAEPKPKKAEKKTDGRVERPCRRVERERLPPGCDAQGTLRTAPRQK